MLHVTTRIQGRKHEGLLQEKGFRGFPSVCIMDSDGQVLATLSGRRTLERMQAMVTDAKAYVVMRKQAAAGDRQAQMQLFVRDLGLSRHSYAVGSLRLAALQSGMPKSLLAQARQALIDLQYREVTSTLRRSFRKLSREDYQQRYTALMLDFYRANRMPSRPGPVLSSVMNHARLTSNVKLFEGALAKYKQVFQDPRYERAIEYREKQLQELRDNDDR